MPIPFSQAFKLELLPMLDCFGFDNKSVVSRKILRRISSAVRCPVLARPTARPTARQALGWLELSMPPTCKQMSLHRRPCWTSFPLSAPMPHPPPPPLFWWDSPWRWRHWRFLAAGQTSDVKTERTVASTVICSSLLSTDQSTVEGTKYQNDMHALATGNI